MTPKFLHPVDRNLQLENYILFGTLFDFSTTKKITDRLAGPDCVVVMH